VAPDQELPIAEVHRSEEIAFVSHAATDKHLADALVARLEESSLPCWIAPRNIPPGKSYPSAIVEAIRSCTAFIVLVSRASNESQQVLRELERAVAHNRRILPVRLDVWPMAPDIEYLTAGVHWLDATVDPESAIVRLIEALHGVPTPGVSQSVPDGTRHKALPSESHRGGSVSDFVSMVILILLLALPLAGLAIYFRDDIGDWAKGQWESIIGKRESGFE
jgi:hypothetical protein